MSKKEKEHHDSFRNILDRYREHAWYQPMKNEKLKQIDIEIAIEEHEVVIMTVKKESEYLNTFSINITTQTEDEIKMIIDSVYKSLKIKRTENKIEVKKVTIEWSEGKVKYCDQYPKEFNSIDEVNEHLMANCHRFPRGGGYDKHKFIVEWNDGEDYTGRLDCKHPSCDNNDLDLRKHIVDFIMWHSGEEKYPWCGEEKYQFLMNNEPEKNKKECVDFLEKYEI